MSHETGPTLHRSELPGARVIQFQQPQTGFAEASNVKWVIKVSYTVLCSRVLSPPIPTQKFIASYLQTRGSWGSASGVASLQVILYF